VPKTAVIGLPGVERARGFEHGAIALGRFDFFGDGADDPVDDGIERIEHRTSVSGDARDFLAPDEVRALGLAELDQDLELPALISQVATGHVIDVQDPPRLLGVDAAFAEHISRAASDHEQHTQPGQAQNHVLGQAVGDRAASVPRRGFVAEGHDRDRSAPSHWLVRDF